LAVAVTGLHVFAERNLAQHTPSPGSQPQAPPAAYSVTASSGRSSSTTPPLRSGSTRTGR